MAEETPACRCGWDGCGEHMCHRCHARPGSRRLHHDPDPYSLAGTQMKLSVRETHGCDQCWEEFRQLLDLARKDVSR